jgi:hypothetical protein
MFPMSFRRAFASTFYIAVFGRDPSEVEKTNVASNLKEDGSNWDEILTPFQASQEAQDWLKHLRTVGAAGPPGPIGPPGPAGKDGVTPTTGTVSGTVSFKTA